MIKSLSFINKGDIYSGVTASIMALPIAFGVQFCLGAAARLFVAIGVGIFAAIFVGAYTQIKGPMNVVSVVIVVLIIGKNVSLEYALPIIFLCFMLAGLFMLLIRVLKISQDTKYLRFSVVLGFLTMTGVINIFLRFVPMLDYKSPKESQEEIRKFVSIKKNVGPLFFENRASFINWVKSRFLYLTSNCRHGKCSIYRQI